MAHEPAQRFGRASDRAQPTGVARRTRLLAVGVFVIVTLAVAATAPGDRFERHTPWNHYALLAECWLAGRLDLGGPPPRYTGNNDFAVRNGKTYVSFPPAPALLLLAPVALAGSAAKVRDGLVFIGLSGTGPMLLFLALERLRRGGRGPRCASVNALLALLLGLGTVYWFSAAQGTVWFAAHVVAMAAGCGYVLASLEARHPVLAGLALGLAAATRPTLLLAAPFFLFEAIRAARQRERRAGRAGAPSASAWRRLGLELAMFAVPVALTLALLAWHNQARFGDPLEFGHRFLQIRWRDRIEHWGLFSPHYLGRNLAIVLAGLPFHSQAGGWQVNGHGLALWLTSPFYLWALWPRRPSATYWAAALCALTIATTVLLYQNSGWVQFGYRFSNDFAPFVFLMIALGQRRLGPGFWLAGALAVLVNGIGAQTFGKAEYAARYFVDTSQRIVHQPD